MINETAELLYPSVEKLVKEIVAVNHAWKEIRENISSYLEGSNYGDFQKLVNLILNKLDLQDFESNRLCRRRDFWADYSNRFERLRILLPKTSQIAIGYQI
ncbi:EH signature domain-containing protein [Nostoc sp.]|uniref:EH signature domain-containing protein n=1 Tax=Nostoc sp. TaxID=1180 RepID=UPI002FFAB4A0